MVLLRRGAIPLRLTNSLPTLCAHANGSWRFQFGAVGWLFGGLGAGPGQLLGPVLAEKAAEGKEEGTATPAGEVDARRNTRWVREFLAGFSPKDLVVQPVIVVPGWYVKPKGNYPVKVMNATYLVGYLTGARRVFSAEQLETTIRRLDERCRVVEF